MKRQIGFTQYNKDGTRKGASFGAGTILHQYIPRSKWRKVQSPEDIKSENTSKTKAAANKATNKVTGKMKKQVGKVSTVKDMKKVKGKISKAKRGVKNLKTIKKKKGKK